MTRCRLTGMTLLLIMTLVSLLPGSTLASESFCTIAPRSETEIAELVERTNGADPVTASSNVFALPNGYPVDRGTWAALGSTLAMIDACAAAGDLPRLLALYTDEFVISHVLAPEPVQIIPGTPTSNEPPSTPQDLPATSGIDRIVEVRLLRDSRIVALVANSHPTLPDQLIWFVNVDGTWRVDTIENAAPDQIADISPDLEEQLLAIVGEALASLDLPTSSATIVSIQSAEWPDSSLGCPQPDGVYAPAITEGYVIIVSTGVSIISIHTSDSESWFICPGDD